MPLWVFIDAKTILRGATWPTQALSMESVAMANEQEFRPDR